ncbi:MAG: 4Fe-4S dicluster domain-containing protein [Desulfobacteraceae bacterium]|nr:4Fe-4S dicluster domain-containing protein [Desulfobacteraceae bacterium]
MIKRSFFSLTQPRLKYDLLEADPKAPESIPIPPNLILLLNEALDNTKSIILKKGDKVKKGEKLSLYKDSTEYTISPVSGVINVIDTYSDDFGNKATYLVVRNDPQQASGEDIVKYELTDDIEVADQYLRTLPGAPPLKILASKENTIQTLVIMCTDQDILSTTAQYVAQSTMEEIKEGVRVLKRIANIMKMCLVVSQDTNMQTEFDGIQTFRVSKNYPSALPAMIMKDHLNMILPAGQSPEDVGVAFITAEAIVSIAKAYRTKTATYEKVLTVIGKDGQRHMIKATIGTPLRRIFNAFSLHINEKDRLIIGGPMKGFATYTHHHPVLPDMDTVIIQDRDLIPALSDNACINCGKCIKICPANIPVNLLVRLLEADQYEEAFDKFDLGSCIECGLCAYVCLARIPLYQYIRLGKHEFLKLKADA